MRLRYPPRKTIYLLLLFIAMQVGVSSCEYDLLNQAEDMISAYDFDTALELLQSIDTTEVDPFRLFQLRGFTNLIEGNTDSGFGDLSIADSMIQAPPNPRYETAKTLIRAATIIIREKNRSNEAMRILDSVIVCDPSLSESVNKLIWKRAIEYLGVPGTVGYDLIEYHKEKDKNVVGRLRGYNKYLSNRYREMKSVDTKLQRIYQASLEFRKMKRRYPISFREISETRLGVDIDTTHGGWMFRMSTQKDSILITAEVLRNNKEDIPSGTIFRVPNEQ